MAQLRILPAIIVAEVVGLQYSAASAAPVRVVALGAFVTSTSPEFNLRNVVAACAAVCVFTISLGRAFPLLSLNMGSWGIRSEVIGLNAATSPVGILLAGLVVPGLVHAFGAKQVAISMALGTGVLFLAYPIFPTLWAWFPLRLLQGLFVGTLFALSSKRSGRFMP